MNVGSEADRRKAANLVGGPIGEHSDEGERGGAAHVLDKGDHQEGQADRIGHQEQRQQLRPGEGERRVRQYPARRGDRALETLHGWMPATHFKAYGQLHVKAD